MKRILLGLVALTAVFLVVRGLVRALASDETKIRWKIERMADGYNRGKAGRAVGPLAKDWRHADYPLDKELLRGAVFRVSMEERHPETRELLTRVELVEDELEIRVDGDEAEFAVVAVFSRLEDEQWEEAWRLRVEGRFRKGERGWEIVSSRHVDLAGTQLSR